tara:strand:- start:265 stop:3411 length:3147 start_codon:yes stop_codon:yes gene_type:complete
MAYIKKDNYPSVKTSGTYPSGSIKELNLNSANLKEFSLGSWEDISISNKRFIYQNIFSQAPLEDFIYSGLTGFEKEELFGFAFIQDENNTPVDLEELENKVKPIAYDNLNKSGSFIESSYPVKINFGLDFIPNADSVNYDQIFIPDDLIIPNNIEQIIQTRYFGIYINPVGTTDKFWGDDDNKIIDYWSNNWNIGYLNNKEPGNSASEVIQNIVLKHETTPFVIKWNTFVDPSSEGNIGSRRYALGNGAYRIEFTPPISKTEYPIKVLDRIKLFSYWDHEYNVIDIKGDENEIEAIQLDVVYAGDIDADAFAQANATLGYLAGEDWLDGNAARNKVMYLPAPFELRANSGQDETYFESNDVSPNAFNNLAEAYTWGNQANEVDHRAASQYNGIPVLRSEDMPIGYEVVIRRPKSSTAEDNLGFTELKFEEDDIKTTDGDEELSLFKESIPRSPKKLSEDIPPALLEKVYDNGNNDNELIGFRQPNNNWSGTGDDAVAVTSEDKVENVTMRARHGYYKSGLPPSRDNNNKGDGKEYSGNLGNNDNDRFPILSIRAPNSINTEDDRPQLPTVMWRKDSEFVLYPTDNIDNILDTFTPNKTFRIKVSARIYIQDESDDDYNIDIGVGVLDLSGDNNQNGFFYTKSLTNSHFNTNLGPTGYTHDVNLQFNEWIDIELYGKVFAPISPANTLSGKPYITINSRQKNIKDSANNRNANDFITNSNHRFYFQIAKIDLEEVEVDLGENINTDLLNSGIYKYQVIQWGDEKQKLTNQQLLESFYFNWYNTDTPSEWDLKKYFREFARTDNFIKNYNSDDNKSYFNLSPHVYTTPGLKTIKTIVYRTDIQVTTVLESKLITTNILINDGLFTSQDFSIFSGTDFNFLPIVDNQAVIGGFNEESKYNNSVSKIVKDDNFIQDDYLERVSSRDYIEKFNGGFLGKQPGQLDLGQTRVFTEPRDIYDFIGANKLEWINQGSGSLSINSLATDIFIRDDKCVVDLNPSNSEYSAIQNQAGSKEIGILIGDYKVNQPEGSGVQKEGIMKTPLLETDNEKQAF